MTGSVEFTIDQYVAGTHTGANNQAGLTDAVATFVTDGVAVGDEVYNLTDGSHGTVSARTETTITATLAGGTDNDWDTSDRYVVIGQNESPYAVKCEGKTWHVAFGTNVFSPAILRVLGALFVGADAASQSIPNLIVYFGKFSETVNFQVKFDDDVDFHSFRKWSLQTAYFDSSLTDQPLRFRWGLPGTVFHDGGNNVGNLTSYRGWFLDMTQDNRSVQAFWTGTIRFAIGVVIQL